MKNSSVVGVFHKSENLTQKLSDELLNGGFEAHQLLVKEDPENIMLFSVAIDNEEEDERVKRFFQSYNAVHTYNFSFVAENANRIRAYIEASAKTNIFSLPKVKSHGHDQDGLNAEVVMGK